MANKQIEKVRVFFSKESWQQILLYREGVIENYHHLQKKLHFDALSSHFRMKTKRLLLPVGLRIAEQCKLLSASMLRWSNEFERDLLRLNVSEADQQDLSIIKSILDDETVERHENESRAETLMRKKT